MMTMESDPTEDAVRKEIADAVRILKDDGIHIHRTYAQFLKAQTGDKPQDEEAPEGGPPPPKPPKSDPPPAKKSGLWWGDNTDD